MWPAGSSPPPQPSPARRRAREGVRVQGARFRSPPLRVFARAALARPALAAFALPCAAERVREGAVGSIESVVNVSDTTQDSHPTLAASARSSWALAHPPPTGTSSPC